MLVIKDWLTTANKKLSQTGITSSRLDSEIILSYVLKKNRTFLHAHPEYKISSLSTITTNLLLKKRINRFPVAYITKSKEFYGRNFIVNQHTLIPRPESEDIIEIINEFKESNKNILVDVGTGTGCLGITAKLENPELDVTVLDISKKALKIARKNSKILSANIKITRSNLLDNYPDMPDIIIANLPYVDQKWPRSPETYFEPNIALFADNEGLKLIFTLIIQANKKIRKNGILILEADTSQHQEIISFAKKHKFINIKIKSYILVFKKI